MREFEFWTVAYRRREEKLLFEAQGRPFKTISNTWRYWCADPHLFEQQGRTWVFAELYDRVLRKGVIGCCELTQDGCTPWQVVLKMPWHLSYPHVYQQDGDIFMIPESYVEKEIALYRAVDFPTRWEKACVLKQDFEAVDSTRFSAGEKTWLITLQLDGEHENLRLFTYGEMTGDGFLISHDDSNKRPGGKLFHLDNKLIRPAQDCTDSYGYALNFYSVEEIDDNRYREKLLCKVKPAGIVSDYPGTPYGIHTYNYSSSFEVIDLKGYEFDIWFHIMRPIWFLWRSIKRGLK